MAQRWPSHTHAWSSRAVVPRRGMQLPTFLRRYPWSKHGLSHVFKALTLVQTRVPPCFRGLDAGPNTGCPTFLGRCPTFRYGVSLDLDGLPHVQVWRGPRSGVGCPTFRDGLPCDFDGLPHVEAWGAQYFGWSAPRSGLCCPTPAEQGSHLKAEVGEPAGAFLGCTMLVPAPKAHRTKGKGG